MNKRFLMPLTLLTLFTAATPLANAAPQRPASGGIVIINGGDRLTPGYRVLVSSSGKLTAVMTPRSRRTPIRRTNQMTAINRQRLFSDLARAEPLNRLGQGGGPSSSGVQVFVRYRGQQSPNLRAVRSSAGKTLYQDVKQALQVLRLPIPDVP